MKPKIPKILEKEVQRQITDYLDLKGYFWWRNNSGAMISEYQGKKRFMRFGQTGSPDIFVVVPVKEGISETIYGQIIGIEIKSSIGKQSPAQRDWQARFENPGGIYVLCRSLEDVMKII